MCTIHTLTVSASASVAIPFLPSFPSFLPSLIYFLRRWGVSSRLRNLELRLRLGGLDLDVRVSLHDYTAFFGNKFWFGYDTCTNTVAWMDGVN